MPAARCSPVPPTAVARDSATAAQDVEYDVPPRAVPVSIDGGVTPFRGCPRCSPLPSAMSPASRDAGETYDVPRSLLGTNYINLML